MRKGRVGDYTVVPDGYKVGDAILVSAIESSNNVAPSSETTIIPTVEKTQPIEASPSAATEVKVTLSSLFYWQCNECLHHNMFLCTQCTVCNSKKNEKSISSALLQLVENAIQNATSIDEAKKNIAPGQIASIPTIVLNECLGTLNKRSIHDIVDHPQKVTNFFYWNCSYCTVQNSYKVHTCKCCGGKVSESS